MKKSSIVWILIIFMAGYAGYAVGTDHNRPRVKSNRYLVHQLLKQPQSTVGGSFTIRDDHWDEIQRRYTEVEDDSIKEEKWDSWTNNTEVRVVYNTIDGEIKLVCDKERCQK